MCTIIVCIQLRPLRANTLHLRITHKRHICEYMFLQKKWSSLHGLSFLSFCRWGPVTPCIYIYICIYIYNSIILIYSCYYYQRKSQIFICRVNFVKLLSQTVKALHDERLNNQIAYPTESYVISFVSAFFAEKQDLENRHRARMYVCKMSPPNNFQSSYPIYTKFFLYIIPYQNFTTPQISCLSFQNCTRETFLKYIFSPFSSWGFLKLILCLWYLTYFTEI